MRTATEIVDDCYAKCELYRKLERELLNGIKYEYSIDEDAQELLEEADPTGRSLEKFCTNMAEVQAHDEEAQKALNSHVKTCALDCCKELAEFRKFHKVAGYYEEVEN